MSGHSKWSNIKRKKEASDAVKGAVFTKVAKEIAVAVKQGGADPETNFRLKDVVSKAKSANMPNDSILRAIKKAAGSEDADDYEEIIYEGYGPGGVAVMVRTLTNNRNRTAGDVRHLFDKHGGNMGVSGSVAFLFQQKGTLVVDAEAYEDEDAVMLDALEAGAEDFTSTDEYYEIITSYENYYPVKEALEKKNYAFADSSQGPVPITWMKIEDEDTVSQLEKMLEKMDENDDIQEVFHNWETE
ncbi:MAG: YebC/PmpR family DNA-binding transcriptional regulator [Clostridiaceae bacterium]|jgi:YebC/PmpR family DNA-binding regulatory protein|nr:YebC/PmpR family DNA-binding transcriptional regulator [Oscillospiraceae bacterium]NLO62946.1 YebC/PmpR family DNA-binding transcriptional regulator [Clostridiaceae bacterium]